MFDLERVTNSLQLLHGKAKGRLRSELSLLLTPELRARRASHFETISKVKTIWQVDAPVNIMDFYFS